MASVLSYLGILFTIALPVISAQGAHNAEARASHYGLPLDPGLRLVTDPFRVVVQRKTPVLLNCSILVTDDRLHPISFSWLKDDKLIDLSKPRPRAQLFSNGSLLLRPRRKKSKGGRGRKLDGLYSCIVATTNGSLIARRVEVVVANIDKNFTKDPVSQEVHEGSVARFECSIRAKPSAFYVWNRNNSHLSQDDPRISILPYGVVQIRNVKMSDAGRYWCQATLNLQSGTWVSSRPAQLRIIPGMIERPLRIVSPPKNISVMVGDTAYLECLSDAWPEPVLTKWKRRNWTFTDKANKPVSNDHSSNLVIENVTPSHADVYECVVTSGRRTVSSFATLSVIAPPKLKEKPISRLYPLSITFTLECKTEGNPTPTISWYHNGIPFRKGHNFHLVENTEYRQKLRFFNAIPSNSGYYQCIANNSAGQVNSLSFTKVDFFGTPPTPPVNVSAVALSATVVSLEWTHEPTNRPYVILVKAVDEVQYSSMGSGHNSSGVQHSCNVTKLKPFTTYSFAIQAFSSESGSLSSKKVMVTTLESVPTKLPVIEVSSPRPGQLNVSWTALSAHDSRGRVIQYKLFYRKASNVDEIMVNVSAPQTSYIINDFVPDTEYEFLVIAGTKMGFTDVDRASAPWVIYSTPKMTGGTTPHFNLLFVNLTSVMLQWPLSTTGGSDEVIGYTVKYWPLGREKEEERREDLSRVVNSHTLYGLAKDKFYEVTLIAVMIGGPASPTTRAFKMMDLSDNLVPRNIKATMVKQDSITINWPQVPRTDLQYEICYGKVDINKTCHISDTNSFRMTGAEPFTGYEFIVRAVTQDWEGKFSHVKRVATKPGLPSAPVNLTVALLKEGSVALQWQRPSQPRGDIVSYLIQYGKQGDSGETEWKRITVSGGANTYQIVNLDPEEYLFKLCAQTSAGMGSYTQTKPFVPVCLDNFKECKAKPMPIPIQPIGPPNERLENKAGASLAPIEYIGIAFGIISLVILVIIIYFCKRRCKKNRDLDPNTSHAPIYPSANGHIPSMYTHVGNNGNHRPANGHAYPLRQTNVDTRNQEFMPMIQIDEHDLPDSKGDSDTFLIPNGVRMNGYIKHYYHNRPAVSSITRLHGDSISIEEMRGLMSGDGGQTTLILSSSLDDMDGNSNGNGGVSRVMLHRGEDHSSEDSGTGSSRAPPRFVGSRSNSNSQGLASPASSPGSCNSHDASNNTLTRLCHRLHHHHHDASMDGFERWGDDIGGMRNDPSTATVTDSSEQQHCHPFDTQQLPSSSTLSSSAGFKFPENDDQVVWVKDGGLCGDGGACSDNENDNDVGDREGDRDSGHGSEVKMNHTTTNTTSQLSGDIDFHNENDIDYPPTISTTSSSTRQHSCDTGNNINDNKNSDNDSLVVPISSPGDSQQLFMPQPSPAPPHPPLSTTTASSSPLSSPPPSSSQQLSSVNPMSTTESTSGNQNHSNSKLPLSSPPLPSSSSSPPLPSSSSSPLTKKRFDKSSTSECDELPPPPPIPTITMATPTQAADDKGSSTTPHGQLGTMGVSFFPSPSSPPFENGSV